MDLKTCIKLHEVGRNLLPVYYPASFFRNCFSLCQICLEEEMSEKRRRTSEQIVTEKLFRSFGYVSSSYSRKEEMYTEKNVSLHGTNSM